MSQSLPDNREKEAVWQSYLDGRPKRVPVRLNTNPRIVLQDPLLNPEGTTFEEAALDPKIHVEASLQWQHYLRTILNHHTDSPTGLPEVWEVSLWVYNVHEAAMFGSPVKFEPGQVPSAVPFLSDEDKSEVLKVDIERPLEQGFFHERLQFWNQMEKVCHGLKFEGRPVRLLPWATTSSDGPVTVGCCLRGEGFLMDLAEDPQFADALMNRVMEAAIIRRRAFEACWGDRLERGNCMADDSCAMLSPQMYEQQVLPIHRRFYDAAPRELPRGMHLCGDASHLFAVMHEQLGVSSFDTGFPLDHGAIRRKLGPDVEIAGGVQVQLLQEGSPDQVHERAREILESGVKEGGRLILQEANNLPPRCPLANLEAMYRAGLEFGAYP